MQNKKEGSRLPREIEVAIPDHLFQDPVPHFGKFSAKINQFRNNGLWGTFDTYSHTFLGKKWWCEASFRNYLHKARPVVASSDATVHLLWRYFQFYAYYPHPRESHQGRLVVDFDAFQRAIFFLSTQDACLRGEVSAGALNDNYISSWVRKFNFERMLKSLSDSVEDTGKEGFDQFSKASLHDGPRKSCSTETLVSVPLDTSGRCPAELDICVSREDLSILLSILLRLRICRLKEGPDFHSGTFDKSDANYERLVDNLVNTLLGSQAYLTANQVSQMVDLFPALQLRSQHLWTTLFQVPINDENFSVSQVSDGIPRHILGAMTLFIPQQFQPHLGNSALEDRIKITQCNILTAQDFINTFTRCPCGPESRSHRLIILSGSSTGNSHAPLLGALVNGSLSLKLGKGDSDEEEYFYLPCGNFHTLFQFSPEFRLFRAARHHQPIAVTGKDGDKSSWLQWVHGHEVSAEKTLLDSRSRCLKSKHPNALGTLLKINFETKTAKLAIKGLDTESPEVVYFKEPCASKEGSANELDEDEDLEFSFTQCDVFEVLGSGRYEHIGGDLFKTAESIFARYWPDTTGPRVTGEELKQRIQGFGSTQALKMEF